MNKFVKYGTIFGFILVLIGTGISTAAFAMGANIYKIGRFVDERIDSGYDEVYGHYEDYDSYETYADGAYQGTQVYIDAGSANGPFAGDAFGADPGDGSMENGSGVTALFENGWHGEFTEVTELELMQNSGQVEFITAAGIENLIIDCDSGDISKTTFEEYKFTKKLTVRADEGDHFIITIPEEWYLDEMELKVRNGELNAENLRASELEVKVSGGTARVGQTLGNSLDLECSGGVLEWTGNGEPVPIIDAESSRGGKITVYVPNMEGMYRYKLECQNGTINLPSLDVAVEGVQEKKISVEGATGTMDIEAQTNGSVVVSY